MDEETLLAAVETAYAVTGAGLPSWPAPWPDGPPDEAYSRVADPQRYRIVGARAAAWVRALTDLGLAENTGTLEDEPAWPRPGVTWQATHLRPRRDGALPVVVALRAVDVAHDSVSLGVGTPPALVGTLPHCGCDACDDGSQWLLDEIDELFLLVVTGDLLVAEGPGWHLMAGERRGTCSGLTSAEADALAADALAGKKVGTTAVISRAWLAAPDAPQDEGSAPPTA